MDIPFWRAITCQLASMSAAPRLAASIMAGASPVTITYLLSIRHVDDTQPTEFSCHIIICEFQLPFDNGDPLLADAIVRSLSRLLFCQTQSQLDGSRFLKPGAAEDHDYGPDFFLAESVQASPTQARFGRNEAHLVEESRYPYRMGYRMMKQIWLQAVHADRMNPLPWRPL